VTTTSEVHEVNAERVQDPSMSLRDYLAAVARRHAKEVVNCFIRPAILELPMVKPSRFMGLDEIERAHALAFANLSEVKLETCEVLSTAGCAMAAGRLIVVCRGKKEAHPFAISSDCTPQGLSRVSWYLDSRGHRHWSDETVL
jgi:hypothetical protein